MGNLSTFVPPNIPSIVDVVRDFGAVGDAVIAADGTVTGTDNTAAFVAAIQAAQPSGTFSSNYGHWVYIPPGRYLVSDKLEVKTAAGVYGSCVRFIGAHVDVSEVVLKNGASGYGSAGTPKPLFYLASQGTATSNTGFKNALYNMTVSIGAGNPGAVAVDMNVSNTGGAKNLRIRSLDPARSGLTGLALTRAPGPAFFQDVQVDGFGYGIDVASNQYSLTFEHITLNNQTVAGLRNTTNVVAVRDLVSNQSAGVPAVVNGDTAAFTTVLDAALSATAGTTAVDNSVGGFMRLRGVRAAGYTNKLANKTPGGSTVDLYSTTQLGDLDEFTNGAVSSLFPGQRLTGLRLPVMEAPEYFDTNSGDWANVMDYGAVHGGTADQAPAIQAAMDSGKSTIFFPGGPPGQTTETGVFVMKSGVVVPPSVKRLVWFMSQINSSGWPDGNTNVFTIADGTSDPLFIENAWMTSTSPGEYALNSYNDAVYTTGSPTVTSASANFTSSWIGRGASDATNDAITALPAGTTVIDVPDSHTLTLSANATASGTRNLRTGGNVDPNNGLKGAHWIEHGSRRPLVMREVVMAGGNLGGVFRSGCGPVHLVGCLASFTQEPGTRVWARGHNMEIVPTRRITNNGGDLWCFGLKIEKFGTIIKTTNGGRTEVEGGFNLPINPDFTQQPAFECVDASHSLSFTGFAFQQYHAFYGVQVRETKNGVTHDLLHSDTVKRINTWSDVVPLHVGRLV